MFGHVVQFKNPSQSKLTCFRLARHDRRHFVIPFGLLVNYIYWDVIDEKNVKTKQIKKTAICVKQIILVI